MVLLILSALMLVLTHLFSHKIYKVDLLPRSSWLSFAGGASLAYAMMQLLPELAEGQRAFTDLQHWSEWGNVWSFALGGVVLFYMLDVATRRSARRKAAHEEHPVALFWANLGAFSLYNAITGYLLAEEPRQAPQAMLFFTLAMALHFMVTDHGLRRDHPRRWFGRGRWVVAGMFLLGVALEQVWEVPEHILYGLMSFLGGSVLLTVIKEELPDDRESRLMPFVLGVAVYAALLIFAE